MTAGEVTDRTVLEGILAGADWADPTMDPTQINWAERQAAALVPFDVHEGRPVRPGPYPVGLVRYGRNALGHWGECATADALVSYRDRSTGHRYLLMVERVPDVPGLDDGWAVPGGKVEPGEEPWLAGLRELEEETGLVVPSDFATLRVMGPRVMPDPRGSVESWMTTVPVLVDLGWLEGAPETRPQEEEVSRTAWVWANGYRLLELDLKRRGGHVFAAHTGLLREILNGKELGR